MKIYLISDAGAGSSIDVLHGPFALIVKIFCFVHSSFGADAYGAEQLIAPWPDNQKFALATPLWNESVANEVDHQSDRE